MNSHSGFPAGRWQEMIRSLLLTVMLLTSAFLLSVNYIGYPGAGKEYFKKVRDERKSVRAGSGYYSSYHGGAGSFRSGK